LIYYIIGTCYAFIQQTLKQGRCIDWFRLQITLPIVQYV